MKILFAVDGSQYTIKTAHYLAKHFECLQGNAELHLLHVKLPIPSGLALVQAERILGKEAVEKYYSEESEKALAPAVEILRKYNIPFQCVYKVGNIAKEIHEYVSKNAMDLIALGSHGHGALKNILMGSVATTVLSSSDTPVLIVR